MKKFSINFVASVLAILCLPAARAAIDDTGMRYVSASEGFGGSLRVFLLSREKDRFHPELSSLESLLGSTRLYVQGDVDLGGGLASTYYWEWRVKDGGKEIFTQAVHAGLKGAFGEVRAGIVEPAAVAIIPSADVTNDVGLGEKKIFDTQSNIIRWVSPEIRTEIGEFKFGASGKFYEYEGSDAILDAFDVAAVYTFPPCLELGIAYQSVNSTLANNPLAHQYETSKRGVRVGMQYGRDNWLLAYNYRTYDHFIPASEIGFNRSELLEGVGRELDAIIESANADFVALARAAYQDHWFESSEYKIHAVSGRIEVDKFTFALGYQHELLSNRGESIRPLADEAEGVTFLGRPVIAGTAFIPSGFKARRYTYSADVSYDLGSKSKIIGAYQEINLPVVDDLKKYYLLYRVDF